MSTEDRRAPRTTRTAFDALVEVGGTLGPSFEARAVNVSEDGMQLRTAYLPEPGQPLSCRFDAGPGHSVLASGEVVWAQGAERGGEFGVRFTGMDAESVESLRRICGVSAAPREGAASPIAPAGPPGSKVRLHIDGLASPMRAKIKDAHATEITVGSDLGFLQVGRALELEDTVNGCKRPASVDRVEVAIDPSSNVPQLVVTLRYADVETGADAGDEPSVDVEIPGPRAREARPAAAARTAQPAQGSRTIAAEAQPADDLGAVEDASLKMKGAFARSVAQIGPGIERLARRTKTAIALLAARRSLPNDDASPRRTTAPAPGGGLHATGRGVFRGESTSIASNEEIGATPRLKVTKRKAVLAAAVMTAAVVGALALKKAHHEPEATTTDASSSAALASAAPATTAAAPAADTRPATPPGNPAPIDPASAFATPPSMGPNDDMDEPTSAHHKHARVAPFGNGPVHHGNVLRLRMDGPIEGLEGAQQPTGFTVKVPGRKSVEAAGPLAARDGRIAAIKVANDSAGAELTVAFKDGVPNYRVSAKGETLIISLAPIGSVDTVADKDGKGSKSPKHGKHHRHEHGEHGDKDHGDHGASDKR